MLSLCIYLVFCFNFCLFYTLDYLGYDSEDEVDTEKFYKLLGIPKTATQQEIKKAYRRKARELHPDKHPNERQKYQSLFQEIQAANEILKDPQNVNYMINMVKKVPNGEVVLEQGHHYLNICLEVVVLVHKMIIMDKKNHHQLKLH